MKAVNGLLTTLMVVGAICTAALGEETVVPPLINYQGTLTDAEGEPLDTAEYDLYFRIWNHESDDAIATNLVWGEKHASVPVVRGMFNVILGGGEPLEGLLEEQEDLLRAFDAPERWLGVGVGSESLSAEIAPRQQLLSAPYAMTCEVAVYGVPVGTIVPWVPPTSVADTEAAEALLPAGYRLCDGQDAEDNPDTVFDERRIPDLTDSRFLMGMGVDTVGQRDGSNTQTTSTVSSGNLNNHKHQTTINNYSGVGMAAVGPVWGTGSGSGGHHVAPFMGNGGEASSGWKLTSTVYDADLNNHKHTVSVVPKYYGVLFIIRVD